MTRRMLPPGEWYRLADNEQLGDVWQLLNPETACVLVVEDAERIVGCWAFMNVLHAEGLYVDPTHRHATAVQRHLWLGMREVMHDQGAAAIWTGADCSEIASLLIEHGASKVPVDSYVLPVE